MSGEIIEPAPSDTRGTASDVPPVPVPNLSDYVRNLDGSPLTDEQRRQIEEQEQDLRGDIALHGGPGSFPQKPKNAHPPFQLPSGEDEPEGYAPTIHTVEQDRPSISDMRSKVAASVAAAMEEDERTRVEQTKKYLADVSLIADDIALAVENLSNAFKHKGFSEERAYDLTKLVVEKKLRPFL